MQLSYGSTSTCTLADELFRCPAQAELAQAELVKQS